MKTFSTPNTRTGLKVKSKLNALLRKEIWNNFLLADRNFISGLKNYYDVNGFVTLKQYECITMLYIKHVENKTVIQKPI